MDEDTEEYEDHGDGKSSISADLIRGHINTIILRALYDKDKYGYEIMNDINQKSHGQYTLKQPTLYSALKRLETQGYIQGYWKTDEVSSGGRRKYFRLTETGKEVTEKNQAEWEYSRTVIDNLISDKNFDFSQPAPSPVDFRLLRQSTSRVTTGSGGDTAEDVGDIEETEDEQPIQAPQDPVIEAVTFTSTSGTSIVLDPQDLLIDEVTEKPSEETETTDIVEEASSEQPQPDEQPLIEEQPAEDAATELTEETPTEPVAEEQPADITASEEPTVPQEMPQDLPQTDEPAYDSRAAALAAEEQKRISHEIYDKLINGGFEKPKTEPEETPVQQDIHENTDYNIYATRPENERNYRNLVDKIFEQTIKQPVEQQPIYQQPIPTAPQQPQPQPQPVYQQPYVQVFENAPQHRPLSAYSDLGDKASNDGIKIQTSGESNTSDSATRTTYNRGATLFTCSLIVGGIILLEFILCLILKDTLAISLAYPFVILALGLVDILVCGILFGAGYGKQVRKPTNLSYIITSIIITALIILIIVIFAIILNVNWSVTTEVLTKVVIPCIVSLNIPIFTLSFYLLTK